MACRMFGDNPLSEPMMAIYQLGYWEQISAKFYWNWNIFIQENSFETVVWKMVAILILPQYSPCLNIKVIFPGKGIPIV